MNVSLGEKENKIVTKIQTTFTKTINKLHNEGQPDFKAVVGDSKTTHVNNSRSFWNK
jgi:hypothetical protein